MKRIKTKVKLSFNITLKSKIEVNLKPRSGDSFKQLSSIKLFNIKIQCYLLFILNLLIFTIEPIDISNKIVQFNMTKINKKPYKPTIGGMGFCKNDMIRTA